VADGVLDDVVELLAACPAFTGVERPDLERLAHQAEIAYVAPDTRVDDAVRDRPLVVQRGALRIYDAAGRTVDLVAAGQFHAPLRQGRVEPLEAGLVVLLPTAAIDLAWSASPALLRAMVLDPARPVVDMQTAAVRTVMRTPLVTVDAAATCRQAAQTMRAHGIASVVVLGGDEPGIVTDRDLRNRLVAEGVDPGTPVGAVASGPLRTVDVSTPLFEALIELLATGTHHLPVTERGRLVGMVTSGDLTRLRTRSPLFLRKALDRADDTAAVAEALKGLPETVAALLVAGTTAGDTGRVVATVTDRVVRRLLVLAQAELGTPPGPYAWLAFGSQARREQALKRDQDSGLVLPDGLDAEGAGWFAALGGWMTDALEACGFPRCPGGVMACEPDWRRTAGEWATTIRGWLAAPSGERLLGAEIGFDVRAVAGELGVERALRPALRDAAHAEVFLAHLARAALRHRPPVGFLGRVAVERSGEHAGTLDVKRAVLLPIVDLARLHTLTRGGDEIGTDERLAAAVADRRVSADLGLALREALELGLRVRLGHHVDQSRDGQRLDDRVDPGTLPPLVRAQLREAFKSVRAAQEAVASVYPGGLPT
jgi:CBS domain-containing protein